MKMAAFRALAPHIQVEVYQRTGLMIEAQRLPDYTAQQPRRQPSSLHERSCVNRTFLMCVTITNI
jgi:hypothetical protein